MAAAKLKKIAEHRATFWVSLAFVGPFALPLLWRDPRYPLVWKIIITLGVIALTFYLTKNLVLQVRELAENIQKLREMN